MTRQLFLLFVLIYFLMGSVSAQDSNPWFYNHHFNVNHYSDNTFRISANKHPSESISYLLADLPMEKVWVRSSENINLVIEAKSLSQSKVLMEASVVNDWQLLRLDLTQLDPSKSLIVFRLNEGNYFSGDLQVKFEEDLFEEAGPLSIYPNPATVNFHLSASSMANGLVHLKVYDSKGMLVMYGDYEKTQGKDPMVSSERLSDGIYAIFCQQDNRQWSGRLVIEKQ